jgi:hypothetical protein
MKRAMVGALALGLVGTAAGARADSSNCSKPSGTACCAAGGGKICVDADGITVAEVARRLTDAIGTEVRVQGPAFEKLTLKVCAPTPEAALAQVANALHAHWRPAFVFGGGAPAQKPVGDERAVTVAFHGASAASAAFLTAAQAGAVLIEDRPLTGKVTIQGKGVPASMIMDSIGVASSLSWKSAYVLQTGPDSLVKRQGDPIRAADGITLRTRPGSPPTHMHRGPNGVESIAPAPGMLVKDPAAEVERLEKEAMRRQELGEWASVFTQDTPRDTKRAARDLRIRVETTIQKLEAYPPQNRQLGMAMWRARYERMLEDYKHLTPDQQKLVQPVLDAMKYFAAPTN